MMDSFDIIVSKLADSVRHNRDSIKNENNRDSIKNEILQKMGADKGPINLSLQDFKDYISLTLADKFNQALDDRGEILNFLRNDASISENDILGLLIFCSQELHLPLSSGDFSRIDSKTDLVDLIDKAFTLDDSITDETDTACGPLKLTFKQFREIAYKYNSDLGNAISKFKNKEECRPWLLAEDTITTPDLRDIIKMCFSACQSTPPELDGLKHRKLVELLYHAFTLEPIEKTIKIPSRYGNLVITRNMGDPDEVPRITGWGGQKLNVPLSIGLEDFKAIAIDQNKGIYGELKNLNREECIKYVEKLFSNHRGMTGSLRALAKKLIDTYFVKNPQHRSLRSNLMRTLDTVSLPDILSLINILLVDKTADPSKVEDPSPIENSPKENVKENVEETKEEKKVVPDEINEYDKSTWSSLYKKAKETGQIRTVDDEAIQVYDRPPLSDKFPITVQDDFIVELDDENYRPQAALLGKANDEIVAFGHMEKDEQGERHFVAQKENIDYEFFRKQSQCCLVLIPEERKSGSRSLPDSPRLILVPWNIYFKEMEKSKRTLCIDFGTSNTTVGSYGVLSGDNEVEIVSFVDKDDNGRVVEHRMVPTVVYAKSIDADSGKVEYLFGYDALQKVRASNYDTDATVFYEIKRWMNDLKGKEEILDENGTRGEVTHEEVIKAYLLYVIETAEQNYFKKKFTKLHFSAPVKLKDAFISEMRKLFKGEYIILDSEESLDEGIAIAYQHIAKRIHNLDSEKVNQYHPIIITDCGGGTTDLARCSYRLKDDGGVLDIRTKFENGDSNFGGNNLTFRIFQMLKIKMYHFHQKKADISMKELIPEENSILNIIDDKKKAGWKEIYKKLEEDYEDADSLIPTKFAFEKMNKNKRFVRRNFYYLWHMAEAYKKSFFQMQRDRVSLDFNKDEDLEIGIGTKDMYYLYWRDENRKLQKEENPLQGLHITNNKIERLLYADIYYLWKRILPVEELEDEKFKFEYKLSGQSCKVDLFAQLLKEFVPGRCLRRGSGYAKEDQMKLDCLEGSIAYIRDKDEGRFKPVITADQPELLYNVILADRDKDHPNAEDIRMLEKGSDGAVIANVLFRPDNTEWLPFRVEKIGENNMVNEFKYDLENGPGTKITLDDLTGKIKEKISENACGLADGIRESLQDRKPGMRYAVFTVPARSGYGMYIFQMKVSYSDDDGFTYSLLKEEPDYYSFESDKLMNFFDGKR